MTLPDDLIQRVAEAKCVCGSDWATDCSHDVRKHPECAVAAVLRALRESEVVMAAARRAAVVKRGTLLAGAVVAAIAKLADDE